MTSYFVGLLLGVALMGGTAAETDLDIPQQSLEVRAAVSAGECLGSAATITIATGSYSLFSSPNYPKDYNGFSKCSWKFQTSTDSHFRLRCDPIYLSWFASLYIVDQFLTKRIGSFWLFSKQKLDYSVGYNTAEVGLENGFLFTAKGFSCRIDAIKKSTSTTNCKCGVPSVTRIVGGAEAKRHSYPWIVGLRNSGSTKIYCGASLISNQFVLTAAHCTRGRRASKIEVWLGVHDQTTTLSTSLKRMGKQIISHPKYDAATVNYDVALIRIDAVDFTITTTIGTVCLPTSSSDYIGNSLIVAGWGKQSSSGQTSNVLRDVTVNVISNSQCESDYGSKGKVMITMICATAPGKDACQGDSGGPLVYKTSKKLTEIVGIASWGQGCADPKYPGVYARVSYVRSWILEQTTSSTFCARP